MHHPATIGRAIRALGSSGEADALVVTLVATRTNDLPGALAALTEAADDQPHLPIVAVVVGADSPLKLGRGNLPVYELPEDAVRSLGHACRYARWRREPAGSKPALARDRPSMLLIESLQRHLAEGAGWQPVAVTRALMACYGDTAPGHPARDRTLSKRENDGSGARLSGRHEGDPAWARAQN